MLCRSSTSKGDDDTGQWRIRGCLRVVSVRVGGANPSEARVSDVGHCVGGDGLSKGELRLTHARAFGGVCLISALHSLYIYCQQSGYGLTDPAVATCAFNTRVVRYHITQRALRPSWQPIRSRMSNNLLKRKCVIAGRGTSASSETKVV